jgi:Transposase IS66 family
MRMRGEDVRILGVSIWVTIFLDKYQFYRPTYRLLADWGTLGLDLSLGTITDSLKRLVPLLEPVYEALVKRSQGQTLWHADETQWLVFVILEGKVGYRWYLWVFHSSEVVIFILAAERSVRGPVVGRKNYYGSASVGSGRLVAIMFSLFQTLCLWGLNPRLWLTAYLEACANAGGRAIDDVDRFMP